MIKVTKQLVMEVTYIKIIKAIYNKPKLPSYAEKLKLIHIKIIR